MTVVSSTASIRRSERLSVTVFERVRMRGAAGKKAELPGAE
jgi:hypothetical protein